MVVSTESVRTVIGIIGNVISFGLFISPSPVFVKIIQAKSVQAFKPDVYVATLLNCVLWVIYGLPIVHPDSILVLSINAVGFGIQSIYIIIFIIYSDWNKRKRVFIALVVEAVFVAILCVITFLALHTHKQRSALVGILCLIFNIIMYTSPLTIMRRVIRTKSVKYMPFYLSLANFLNGGCWFIYGMLKFDPFVVIPNGLGCISGIIQLILYATYYKSTNWEEETKPQMELAGRGNSEV